MSPTTHAVVGALAALVLLAGCSGAGDAGAEPDLGGGASNVKVDTPKLRALRHDAGIEPCPAVESPGKRADGGLPATRLPCLGGGDDVALSGLHGKPMVVNIWASWCKPCRDEMPYLQRLHEETDGRLRMIGVDFQDTAPAAALHLAARTGVTYPLLADPEGSVRKDLGVIGLPQTVFVDRSGRIVATERSEVTSYRQLVDLVRKHLKVTP